MNWGLLYQMGGWLYEMTWIEGEMFLICYRKNKSQIIGSLYLRRMKEYIFIDNGNLRIPAVVWGKRGDKVFIAVHGDMSDKEDMVIELFAQNAVLKGYCVLSFDLPEHGDRRKDSYACSPPNCISDLVAVYDYATSLNDNISLFACSLGAYFSLLAYHEYSIQRTLFLSPVVNMEKLIQSMMKGFQISDQRLEKEKQLPLPIGKTLDWDYYVYVRQHPVNFTWNSPVSILYGSKDNVSPQEEVEKFSCSYNANLTVREEAEHYFSTTEQLYFFENWLNQILS